MIYKVKDLNTFTAARATCDEDSIAAGAPGFLHLPMPRNDAENEIYLDIVQQRVAWLDITEVRGTEPGEPRSYVYRDGSPVTYFNWEPNEPNSRADNYVEIFGRFGGSTDGQWNDNVEWVRMHTICTYLLEAGAENTCTWLTELQNNE